MNKNNMPVLLGALVLCAAAPASAALYRCGNVFQDRPCEAPAAREAAAPAAPASAAAPAARRAASATPAEATRPQEVASAPQRPEASGTNAAPATAAASAPVRKGPPSLACPNLREQRNAIEARLRTAARPETTQMYERQLRGVERNLGEGNC